MEQNIPEPNPGISRRKFLNNASKFTLGGLASATLLEHLNPNPSFAQPPHPEETTMSAVTFNDLLEIRKGGENLTMGGGSTTVEPATTVEEWEIKAQALRDIFRQTLGRTPDIDCPLSPEVTDETDFGDHIRRTIAYNVEPDERINAYVLIPKNRTGKTPAVLCIHQTTPFGKEQVIGTDTSEKGQSLSYALHLVQRGFITFAWDLLTANERKFEGLRDFDTAPFYEKHPEWSIRGKDLWDLSRAIDILETQPEVDPERIGSIGHSQGGGITIHAMALEPRIKAGVSSCGDWPARFSKNPFNHARTGWWIGRPFLRPYCYAGKPFPIDLHDYLALAAPRAIMPISALNDFQYTLEEESLTRPVLEEMAKTVSSVFALYGVEQNFRQIIHTEGHGFTSPQHAIAYAFLEEKLKP